MLKAILIDIIPPTLEKEDAAYRLEEAENLIKTYGGIVLVKKFQKRILPNYKTYIGLGKIEEIIKEGKEYEANILIVNNELKPMQIYNIGEMLREAKMEVWDRIDLILKIFQKHASTREAKLEIELASIRHMGPRIYGMGMQLTRQGGGIGTRGKGETNLEFMKRHLSKHEDRIKEELENCKKVRELHRNSRRRKNLKTVGIIGYTNAGKSSLLNALTHKGAYTADKLFATLDTRIGKLYFENSRKEVLISDTIGFIRDLPTTLIKSFQSTLEETNQADLLLHVIDINDEKKEQKIKIVHSVLEQIKASDKKIIYVFNKIDLLSQKSDTLKDEITDQSTIKNTFREKIQSLEKKYKQFDPCFVSTISGENLSKLKEKIEAYI